MNKLIILWETTELIKTEEIDEDGDEVTKVNSTRHVECFDMIDILKIETKWEKLYIFHDNGNITEIKGHFEIYFR